MELGATVCTPRSPACDACPVRAACRAHAAGLIAGHSRPNAATAKASGPRSACARIHRDGKVLLVRRQSGLLAGMWSLPGSDASAAIAAGPATVTATLRALGVTPRQVREAGEIRHVFTHRDVTATVFDVTPARVAATSGSGEDMRWVAPSRPRVHGGIIVLAEAPVAPGCAVITGVRGGPGAHLEDVGAKETSATNRRRTVRMHRALLHLSLLLVACASTTQGQVMSPGALAAPPPDAGAASDAGATADGHAAPPDAGAPGADAGTLGSSDANRGAAADFAAARAKLDRGEREAARAGAGGLRRAISGAPGPRARRGLAGASGAGARRRGARPRSWRAPTPIPPMHPRQGRRRAICSALPSCGSATRHGPASS